MEIGSWKLSGRLGVSSSQLVYRSEPRGLTLSSEGKNAGVSHEDASPMELIRCKRGRSFKHESQGIKVEVFETAGKEASTRDAQD